MKRQNGLYEQICSFENLLAAAYRARRGKRARLDVLSFHFELERHLLRLRAELLERDYKPGGYRSFWIRDPKRRLISAAPYRDRVVHHALCRIIEPVFERGFIHASYANRVGKGTHRALDHATRLARRQPWVLKCDIEKYFPSIDHEILLARLARRIKCRDTMWLLNRIIANSNAQEDVFRYFPGDTLFTPLERRRGIPIGNLTSQFFANVYLDGFDHFVQERLGCSGSGAGYIRFADDFLVFGESKEWLAGLPVKLQEYLNGLRLRMHAGKCQVMPVKLGVPFLGWRVYPDHRRLRRATGVRIQRRWRELVWERRAGKIKLRPPSGIDYELGRSSETWRYVGLAAPPVCRSDLRTEGISTGREKRGMTNFEKEKKRLQNHWPLVGKLIRRRACTRLVTQPVAEAVPLLSGALRDTDAQVRDTAVGALRSLRSQALIDVLCTLWVNGRASELGSLIAEQRYVAAQPVLVRVLSALKAKRLEVAGESAAAIPTLVGAFGTRMPVSPRRRTRRRDRCKTRTPLTLSARSGPRIAVRPWVKSSRQNIMWRRTPWSFARYRPSNRAKPSCW